MSRLRSHQNLVYFNLSAWPYLFGFHLGQFRQLGSLNNIWNPAAFAPAV